MMIINRDSAFALVHEGEQAFRFPIELLFITKIQLYLSGNVKKGIELFGVGPQEIRGFGFMAEFFDLINEAVRKEYRVFAVKEGKYFGEGDWNLQFIKKLR